MKAQVSASSHEDLRPATSDEIKRPCGIIVGGMQKDSFIDIK